MKTSEEKLDELVGKLLDRVTSLEVATLVHLAALTVQVTNLNVLVQKCVNQDQFHPIKLIVYGVAAALGAGIVSGILTLVIRR